MSDSTSKPHRLQRQKPPARQVARAAPPPPERSVQTIRRSVWHVRFRWRDAP